jgi:hypothetical protein
MGPIYRYNMSIAQLFPVKDGRAMLTSIGTQHIGDHRGKGDAQRVLDMVLADADAEGVTLVLSVDPDPDTDFDRLRSWYGRNGFVLMYADSERAMIRKPKEPK